MPFRKVDSLEQAEESVWLDRSDPGLLDRIRRVWSLGFRLAPRYFPPGLHKFRSLEEKNRFDARQRHANVEAQQRRLRERRDGRTAAGSRETGPA